MSEWTVIVPAKPWHLAKSRLQSPHRVALARAFTLDVLDTVTSTSGVARVVVVSAEPGVGAEARRQGAAIMVDRPLVSRGGLNVAVDLGRRWAQREAPGSPVAVVPADLPSLTPEDLVQTLRLLGRHEQAYVPDLGGEGTSVVAARCPAILRTAYGRSSDEKHEGLGLTRVLSVPPSARSDVDTYDDLLRARSLGVGRHTQDVFDQLAARQPGHYRSARLVSAS